MASRAATSLGFGQAQPPELKPSGGVEFREMTVKRILNRCNSSRVPFRWTINPYRGCEFGCVYCYARYTHDFLDLRDPMDFERRIFVKRRAAEVLARTISHTPVAGETIAIGTATDPYQPAERRYEVTRSMLKVFAGLSGLSLSLTTKSALILRDLDLLREINRRSRLSVAFSLITLSRRLQRKIEPRAPRPALRLRALETVAGAGIRCSVLVMPVIPFLTDRPVSVEAVIRAAREAGASAAAWRPLFLRPAAARRFLPFVRENFPREAERFAALYGRSGYAPREYEERIGAMVTRLKIKYGFFDPSEFRPSPEAGPPPPLQLSLRNRP